MKRTMLLSFSIRVLVTIFVTCITGLFQKTSAQEIFSLPFNEGWTSGNFTLNNWQAGQNWVIDGQAGNPKPAAKFKWDPIINNYSSALESWWIDDSSTNTTTYYNIWFDFDIKLSDRTSSGTESLRAEVWNDSAWIAVAEFTNDSSFDWCAQHININSEAKHHAFKIRFVAQGTNSNAIYYWLVDNIHVCKEYMLYPPQNLIVTPRAYTGTIVNDMHLTWLMPEGGGGSNHLPVWIHWDNGENSDAIGTGGATDFDVAVRFDVSQLAEYDGMAVTKVAFWPNEAACEYSVRIWQGEMAANLLVDQAVSNPIIGTWNEVELDNPLTLNINQELWFGVRCNTTTGYPAGCDAGPQVPDYGQWIYWSGAWTNLVDLNSSLTYNWNLQAYLEPLDDQQVISTNNENRVSREQDKRLMVSNHDSHRIYLPAGSTLLDAPFELNGFNIYRRKLLGISPNGYIYSDWGIVNTSLVTNLEYWDWNMPNNNCWDYYVTAVYTEGESISSNFDTWNCIGDPWGRTEYNTSAIFLHPNPASSYLEIDFPKNINLISIYNSLGSVISEQELTGVSHITIITSDYPSGTYFIKLSDNNGNTFIRKFLVVK